MAIYNLGAEPQPQESAFTQQLARTAGAMVDSGLEAQKVKEARSILATQEQTKAALDKKEKDMQFFRGTWQNLSDKPEKERQLFLDTDQGKEYLKTVKKYMPEVFDENSEPILFPSSKDPRTFVQAIDDQIAGIKAKLVKGGPDSLTEGEVSALKMEGYKDELGETLATLMKNTDYTYLIQSDKPEDQKAAQQMVSSVLQQTIAAKKQAKEMGSSNRFSDTLKLGDQASGLTGATSNFTNPFNSPTATENPLTSILSPTQKTSSGSTSGGRYKVRRLN